MSIVYSSIPCCEEVDGCNEGADDKKTTASVKLRCAYSDRWALVADILNSRAIYPKAPPEFVKKLRAKTASIAPFATDLVTDGQALGYGHAIVTINYETSDRDDQDGEDSFAEEIEPSAEFITLDFKRFRWKEATGDPLQENEAPGRLVKGLNLVRTWYDVQFPLPGALLTLIGKVNEKNYASSLLGLTFEKETLLFQPPSIKRKVKSNGTMKADLTMKMSYKPETWNKYWRAKSQAYEKIFVNDTTWKEYKNYPTGDFTPVLF